MPLCNVILIDANIRKVSPIAIMTDTTSARVYWWMDTNHVACWSLNLWLPSLAKKIWPYHQQSINLLMALTATKSRDLQINNMERFGLYLVVNIGLDC